MGSRTINYLNGVTPATARKIACYCFGVFYVNLIENKVDFTYDVFLKEGADKNEIKRFRNFWGENWRVFIFKPEN